MNRRVAPLITATLVIGTLAACSGSSGKAKSTTTSTAATAATTTAKTATTPGPTTTTVDPTPPSPIVGKNGVTVTYTSVTSGTIAPRVMAGSEAAEPAPRGGALFRLTHGAEPAVWGAVDGQLYNELSTRSDWAITKLNSDPAWSPAGCAGMPSAVVGDRWMVTIEGSGGHDELMESTINGTFYNEYFVRVYDRQTNTFTAIIPITTAEPQRWQVGVSAISTTEVAIAGRRREGTDYRGAPTWNFDVIRTINLATMTFTDAPYDWSRLPTPPKAPASDTAFEVIFKPLPESAFPPNQQPSNAVWFISA